jgi:hypothetical protein
MLALGVIHTPLPGEIRACGVAYRLKVTLKEPLCPDPSPFPLAAASPRSGSSSPPGS